MYPTNDPRMKHLRQETRKNATDCERILWSALRKRQLGYRFRRNHQIGRYYLDFYCHEKRLGIEVDGAIHNKNEQKEYDQIRDNDLQAKGITIIRFTNNKIQYELQSVLLEIQEYFTSSSL